MSIEVSKVGLSQYRAWLRSGRVFDETFTDVTCGYVVVSCSSIFGKYVKCKCGKGFVRPYVHHYFCDIHSAINKVRNYTVEDLRLIRNGYGVAIEYEIWHIVEDSCETVFSDPVSDSFAVIPCSKRDFLFYVEFGGISVPDFLRPELYRYCLVGNDLDGYLTVYGCDDDISALGSLCNLLMHVDSFFADGLRGGYRVIRLDD